MNPQPDEFQELRRLLALKRYEQPPPGHFNDFSQQVIIRIRAGEHIDHFSILEAFSWEAPWLQRLWGLLETRPILAGGFGVAVCCILMAGMFLSESREAGSLSAGGAMANSPAAQQQAPFQISSGPGDLSESVAIPAFSGMDGVAPAQPTDSLFRQFKDSQAPRVDLINTSLQR
jgi:hypothetical protein